MDTLHYLPLQDLSSNRNHSFTFLHPLTPFPRAVIRRRCASQCMALPRARRWSGSHVATHDIATSGHGWRGNGTPSRRSCGSHVSVGGSDPLMRSRGPRWRTRRRHTVVMSRNQRELSTTTCVTVMAAADRETGRHCGGRRDATAPWVVAVAAAVSKAEATSWQWSRRDGLLRDRDGSGWQGGSTLRRKETVSAATNYATDRFGRGDDGSWPQRRPLIKGRRAVLENTVAPRRGRDLRSARAAIAVTTTSGRVGSLAVILAWSCGREGARGRWWQPGSRSAVALYIYRARLRVGRIDNMRIKDRGRIDKTIRTWRGASFESASGAWQSIGDM